MMMITRKIAELLVKADEAFLASRNGTTADEIAVKFFAPWGAATWWIVSGTPLDAVNGEPCELADAKDWHLFGYVDLGIGPGCAELGYVLLSQLAELRGPMGLFIERDRYFTGKLSEIMGESR